MISSKLSFWQKFLPPVVLSIITVIFYYPSLFYIFLFDDLPTITENMSIVKGSPNLWDQVYSSTRWVSRLLSKFCYKYWQANPVPYRIINLFIHILLGVLIYFFLLKVLSEVKSSKFIQNNFYVISILSAGLFLLHPFQTQTATYICQMQLEGGMTLFVFLTLFFFLYAAKVSSLFFKTLFYIVALFFTSISAGTKEAVIVLPFLLFLVDWFFVAQGDWKNVLKRLAIHLVFFAVFFGTLDKFRWNPWASIPKTITQAVNNSVDNNRGNILTAKAQEKITIKPFFLSQFKIILHYISMYFLPTNMSFDYETRLSYNFFDFDVFVPLLILFLILGVGLLLFLKNKSNVITFCILWFFITIFPRASLNISTELVSDYRCYLSAFGILFLIAIILVGMFQFFVKYVRKFNITKFSEVSLQLGFLFLVIVSLGFSTKSRNFVWSSELLFWEDVVKKTPTKARNFNNYGVALLEAGRVSEAMEIYQKACQLDPTYAEPVINLAFNYQLQGNTDLALEYYKRALSLREVHPEMYLNLGILHLHKQSYEKAEICFKDAIKYKAYYSRAYFALAVLCQIQNRLQESLEYYKKGLEGDYQTIEHYYQHGVLAEKLNKIDSAIVSLEIVKELNSNYKDTAFVLGSCYYHLNNHQKASENFGLAYKNNPQNNVIAYNYGQTLLSLRKFDQALPIFEQCKKNQDSLPFAPLHYAKCLLEIGQKNKAKKELQILIKTTKFEYVKNDGQGLLKSIS